MASDLWAGVGSALAFLLAVVTVAINHVKIKLLINKISTYFNPYIQITIPEYGAECFRRSDFFITIEAYLSESCAVCPWGAQAKGRARPRQQEAPGLC